MKRLIPFGLAAVLLLTGCGSFQDVDAVAERIANATATAIWEEAARQLAQTATAEYKQTQAVGPTETPNIIEEFATELAPGPEEIPFREAIGSVDLKPQRGRKCAPYFKSAGDALVSLTKQKVGLGVLCPGTPTLEVLSQAHVGRVVEVRLGGLVELHELGLTLEAVEGQNMKDHRGTLHCEPHGTDHAGEVIDTHCHILNGTEQVAQLPEEWTYEILSESLGPNFTLVVRVPQSVWVRGVDVGEIRYTQQ